MLLLLLACRAPVDDTGAPPSGDSAVDADSGEGPGDDSGEAPPDLDGDGHVDAEAGGDDCDDLDPAVHPGADDPWNGADDDCDGRVDADGAYTGDLALQADAVYEGTAYSWTLSCPLTLDRLDNSLDFLAACAPTSGEAVEADMMDRMLGTELRLQPYPGDTDVRGEAWSGWVLITSSGSYAEWDTEGDGAIVWASTSTATLTVAFEGPYLQLAGEGELAQGE